MNFFTALGLLFIALKLFDKIDWSWWVVLLPVYGGFIFVTLLAFIVALGNRRN